MAKVKGGLGKGLNALIPDRKPEIEGVVSKKGDVVKISIHEIAPNRSQPRKDFAKERLEALSDSIRVHGIIQPIVIRPVEEGYEIVAGERRWRAAREAGLKEIPCIVKDLNDQQGIEIALIENLQREDLNPIEEALAYENLMNHYNLTQEEIAQAIGKSRPYIANTMRLLNLDDGIQEMLIQNKITSGHARALLRLENAALQREIAKEVDEKGLSVRETEALVAKILKGKIKKALPKKAKDTSLLFLEDALKSILGTKVNIIRGKKKGKIEIEYYSDEELERLVDLLQRK
ncbi:ParB/RepB/Spo0J family partition protein [Thermotalea metallivorans]|uniref:Putative chromosome-partitioning protein ParB n=1 Tax=Thermotalea metallivorans TaxID=520762 RepID=A0A140KZX7_9FIRM|nr:ParB/RepB/Spo0J family partition protein [Thermotalea metallivorans]KXG73852.1 putative chromosome-partitioning protein ParB [Thermotalea metallivorans]